jgi:hypothetical protein
MSADVYSREVADYQVLKFSRMADGSVFVDLLDKLSLYGEGGVSLTIKVDGTELLGVLRKEGIIPESFEGTV